MSLRRKRYVRDDEIKYRLQGPRDGQIVKARITGNKTYFWAQYDCKSNEFRAVYGTSIMDGRYIMGWLPLTEEEEQRAREEIAKKGKS